MHLATFRCNVNNIRQLPDCSHGSENYNSASKGPGFGSDPEVGYPRRTRNARREALKK